MLSSARAGPRRGSRASPSGTARTPRTAIGFLVVRDQDGRTVGAYHLDVEIVAVDLDDLLLSSTRVGDAAAPAQAASRSIQRMTICSSTPSGTAPLPSTVPWKARRSNRGPSRCSATVRS